MLGPLFLHQCRYFEHAKCKSSYDLRPLLENVQVWMSADINTHYTLEGITTTKSGGGSSVRVNNEEGKTNRLEIYVSMNRHRRDCALITDFPEQLIAALKLAPVDLPGLLPLLQVPTGSLKALLIKKGITDGNTADNYEQNSVADSSNEGSQIQSDGRCEDDVGDDAITTYASIVSSDSEGSTIVESVRAPARSVASNASLRPHVEYRPSSRPTTPEPRRQGQPESLYDESTHERPLTPHLGAAGLYTTDNRNRNRERLRSFARNADPLSSNRSETSNNQSGGGAEVFDMDTLRTALDSAEPTIVSTLVPANTSPRRRVGPILNRDKEQTARDFEVGFLGELFVSSLNSLFRHVWPTQETDSRLGIYVITRYARAASFYR